jgi:hypothetical protein
VLESNLSHGPGETNHLDTARAGTAQSRRRGTRSRAARVDVVDETNGSRRGVRGAKRPPDVAPALDEAEPPLPPRRAHAFEQARHGQPPRAAELAREPLSRMVASP